MAYKNVNRQNLLSVKLLQLKRHFATCQQCRSAIKAKSWLELCEWAQEALIEVAGKWDSNIPSRLAARKNADPHIFPCPDLNAHGPAYALTAEPLIAQSVQGRLI